ncbi:hypothetical protein CesoFtcFv8_000469 [Champsocephalus esox]|uniref:Uncharacterized protein n=1 Tax=Champsocephalus esox TaxID=159716 RepID=A0AAN8D6Z8_9TELE|nr:hypothetical protein CesoFtcFv8_000469 [Champsocephalus esox]
MLGAEFSCRDANRKLTVVSWELGDDDFKAFISTALCTHTSPLTHLLHISLHHTAADPTAQACLENTAVQERLDGET